MCCLTHTDIRRFPILIDHDLSCKRLYTTLIMYYLRASENPRVYYTSKNHSLKYSYVNACVEV